MISLSGRLLGNNDMANYIKRIKLTNLKAGILTFQLSSDVLFKFQIDSTWSQGSSLKYNREWISATIRVFRFFKIFLVTWRANCKRERETAQTGHEEFLPTDKENGCRKLAFNPKSGQLKIKWEFFGTVPFCLEGFVLSVFSIPELSLLILWKKILWNERKCCREFAL